jgi:hypothetical protein
MGAVIGAIIVVCYIVFGRYLFKRYTERESEDGESLDYDAVQMRLEVKQLYDDMEHLQELDEMMIDLRLCKPEEMQRSFRMEWQSLSGKNHRFDFWADGENQSTDYLLGLAQSERDSLNDVIMRRISGLYYRANALNADRKTVRKTETAGEWYE